MQAKSDVYLRCRCDFAKSVAALGDDVVVVKPGVACKSPDALAKLTRPDGSSRSEGATASKEALQVARDGGCTPLRLGQEFTTTSTRKNTSIAFADDTSLSQRQTVIVPNIDLQPAVTNGIYRAASNPNAQEAATTSNSAPLRYLRPSNYFSTDGIALGDKGSTAVDLLAKRGFEIEQFPSSNPSISVVTATKRDDTGSQSYSIDLLNGKVMYVDRDQTFADGHQPLIEALRTGVRAKYGSQASMDLVDARPKHDVNMTWSYSPAGALAKEDLCFIAENSFNAAYFANVKDATGTPRSVNYWMPHLAPSACGRLIQLYATANGNPDLTTVLEVRLYDGMAFASDIRAENDAAVAAIQKKLNEAKKVQAPAL